MDDSLSDGFTSNFEQAASALAMLRSNVIYHDNIRVSAHYHVLDASGRPQVSRAGLTIGMEIAANGLTVKQRCSKPSKTTGSSNCFYNKAAATLASAFSTVDNITATVTVRNGLNMVRNVLNMVKVHYSGKLTAQSASMEMTLMQRVSHSSLPTAGMVIDMPYSPRFPGDLLVSQVHARTSTTRVAYALSAFSATTDFDIAALEYVSVSGSSLYTSPTVNAGTPGQVTVVTSGLASGVTAADVTGSAIFLFSVTMRVEPMAGEGTFTDVLSLTVNEMVSTSTVTIPGTLKARGQVNDARGGGQTSGTLQVTLPRPVGIYAYASQAELFNTAALNAQVVSASIHVRRVFSEHGVADASVQDAECTSAAEGDVIALSGCTLSLTDQHTAGSRAVLVNVADGAFAVTVALLVWYPQSVSVTIADATLNAIAGSTPPGSTPPPPCVACLYQRSAVQLWVSWGGTGLVATVLTDVSHLIAFASSNSTTASVVRNTVVGHTPGSSQISISAGAADVVARTRIDVVVSDVPVTVTSLQANLFVSAVWSGVPTRVSTDDRMSFTATVSFKRTLRAEGQEGVVYVCALFSDGSVQDVTRAEGAHVVVDPIYNTSLEVDHRRLGGADFTGVVPVGASPLSSSTALSCTWTDVLNGGGEIGSGYGQAIVDLPLPTSASIILTSSKITRPSDPSTSDPINTPTSTAATVTVTFEDGTTKDFSLDSRAVLTVFSGDDLVRFTSANIAQVKPDTSSFGPVEIEVTFPIYAPGLTATASLSVVGMSHLKVSSAPYPAFPGSEVINETVLSNVLCSETFQRSQLAVTSYLTDGTSRVVTTYSTFSNTPSAGMSIDAGAVVSVSAAGVYQVRASYATVDTNAISMLADASPLGAVSVSFTTSWAKGPTFSAIRGNSKALSATMTFTDGTQFTDIVNGVQSSWISPTDIATFTSEMPKKISVTDSGIATIGANHYQDVQLTVTAKCTGGQFTLLPEDSERVYVNLMPDENDFDLGDLYGLQFSNAIQIGSTFDVPVRVQVGPAMLNLFDLLLEFDSTQLMATACQVGSSWAPYSFTCTLNNPPNQVLITGTEIATSLSGQVSIASVTFEALTSNVFSPIVGTVQGLHTSSFEASQALGNTYPIIAGQGIIVNDAVVGTRRRALLDEHPDHHDRVMMAYRRRSAERARTLSAHSLLQAGDILGDVNGDGFFDTFDVQETKKWVAAMDGYKSPAAMSAFQRQQLDPTLEFLSFPSDTLNCPPGWTHGTPCPSTKDAQYLSYVYAKFYRFLKLHSQAELHASMAAPAAPGAPLLLSCPIYASDNAPVKDSTVVKFELATSAVNQAMQVTLGSNEASTGDGLLVTAVRTSDGIYSISAMGPTSNGGNFEFDEDGIQVAVIIYTFDAFGET
eukprot:gene7002-8348_t